MDTHPFHEGFVLEQDEIGRKHHEASSPGIDVLGRSRPIFGDPFQVGEQGKVRIVERGRSKGPRSTVPRRIFVAPSECVRTRQGHNFLIVEAHPIENRPQMGGIGRIGQRWTGIGVGKASVGCDGRFVLIDPTTAPTNDRSTHFLDGRHYV